MRRPAALLAACALFFVGALVGGLAARLLDSDRWREPPARGERFLERLSRDLDLTPDQRASIERILRESHAEADALHDEMLPRVRAHVQGTRERVRAVLTPEQQPEFDRLAEHHRRRVEQLLLGGGRRRHPHRPPPPSRSDPD